MLTDVMRRRTLRFEMRKVLGTILIRFACLPSDLIGGIWLLAMMLIDLHWGAHFRQGILVAELRNGGWLYRTWFRKRIAFTFGHVVLFNTGRTTQRSWTHQRIHVDQSEAACTASLLIAATVAAVCPLAALIIWVAGYPASILAAGAVAWLRGGNAHHDSIHERAAYALDGMIDSDKDVTRRSYRPDLKG